MTNTTVLIEIILDININCVQSKNDVLKEFLQIKKNKYTEKVMNHRKKTVSCIVMAEKCVKVEEWGDTSGGLHKSKALESLVYSY